MKIGTLKKEILIPKILQILKTLGWGNKEELTNALCSEEINQEKIFYVMSYKSMGLKTSKPNYQKKRSISLQETNPELKPKISTSETVLTLSKNEKETKEQEYNLDNIILSSNNYTKTNENESESENQPSNDEEFLISSPDLEKSPNSTRKGAISMKNSLENEENENNIYQMGTPRFHRTKDDDIGSLPITQSPKTRWFGSLFHKKQMENLDLNNNIQNTINLDINLTNQENETEKTEKKNEEEIKPQLFSLEYQISLFETITRFQTSLMAMNFQWQFPSIKLIKVKYQKMKMKILFQQSKNDKKTKVIIKYTKGDPKTFNLLTKNLIQKTSN